MTGAGYNYDYTKRMMMKLFMAEPDRKGGSHIIVNCERALEIIRKTDNLTLGAPKIVYLVGWQYNGHDDKYPDFFEVNPGIKRTADATAHESLLWLMREAKRYNTVVSLHINFNDAYEDAPSFEKFKKASALIRKKNGEIDPVEKYNGKNCYKTCLKTYWESGLFCEMFDRLLEFLPLRESGTVHVDNFQCYQNYHPAVSIREMQEARRKMVLYAREKGVDITSEFTYKEPQKFPNHKIFGLPRNHAKKAEMDTLGIIPASWWCSKMRRDEYLKIPPEKYCGGIYKDKNYGKFLYGNMHGEDIWRKFPQEDAWVKPFLCEFATIQLPFQYLCRFERKRIIGRGLQARCYYSGNVISYRKSQTIFAGSENVKEKDTVFLPLTFKEGYLAYSKAQAEMTKTIRECKNGSAQIYLITAEGLRFIQTQNIVNHKLALLLKGSEAYYVAVNT